MFLSFNLFHILNTLEEIKCGVCFFLLCQSEHLFKIFLYSVGDSVSAVPTMQEEMNLPIHIARLRFYFILSFFMCHAAATLVI